MRRASTVVVLVAGMVFAAHPATAAPGGGACHLAGTAVFSPQGPNNAGTPFSYSFSGTLSDCQSNVAGAPTAGTVEAGKQVTIGGAIYQEPIPQGTGTCASGTTSGTSVARWADGTTTVVGYSTTSAGPAVNLQGTVVPSVTVTLVSGPVGSPPTQTISSTGTVFAPGQSAQGALGFSPDPTECDTARGLTQAGIDGVIGIGTAS